MNWGFLENVLSGVNRYSTAVGRVWLSVVFLFRILVYVAAAEQVWKDEQKDFVCNTQQPGCDNACFDHFFPISQVRLWALQLIAVSTPSLLVALHVAYRGHREAKHKRKLYRDKGSIDGGLFLTYAVSLLFKTAFEVGSLLAFYFLFNGFDVPTMLRCSQDPCPNTVDCFISKATEKKVFLYIMGCTSILCTTLNLLELGYIVWKQLWKCFSRRYVAVETRAAGRRSASVGSLSAHPTAGVVNNTVNTAGVVNNTVNTADEVNNTVNTADEVNNTVNTAGEVNNTVNTAGEVNNTVNTADEVNNTVNTAGVVNNTVNTAGEVNNTVNTAGEVNNTVNTAGEVNNTVNTAGEVNNTVNTADEVNNTVNTAGEVNNTVNTAGEVNNTVNT